MSDKLHPIGPRRADDRDGGRRIHINLIPSRADSLPLAIGDSQAAQPVSAACSFAQKMYCIVPIVKITNNPYEGGFTVL